MSLLEFFRPQKKTSASVAKERLQIIVAERRSQNNPAPSYLPQLKEDILKVIAKYVAIDPSMVELSFEHKGDDIWCLSSTSNCRMTKNNRFKTLIDEGLLLSPSGLCSTGSLQTIWRCRL